MMREFEKKIFKQIGFADKFLKIKANYINDGLLTPTFKKEEILKTFKELGYTIKYLGDGGYEYLKVVDIYKFRLLFDIKKNSPLEYLDIFVNNKFIEDTGITQLGGVLWYLPYDEELANSINEKGFGLNSLVDLRDYLKEMLQLFEEFANEYILEIKAGNNP
jgi:hypothetical protein